MGFDPSLFGGLSLLNPTYPTYHWGYSPLGVSHQVLCHAIPDDSAGRAGEVPGTDGGRRKKPAAELPGSIDFIFLQETMEFP